MRNTVVLTGMMGSGKTTLGKELAKNLKIDFFDADKEIEKFTNMTIPTIFKKKGEIFFRKIEEKICIDLINNEKKVVSIGGGAFLNNKIRQHILKNSKSIWIHTNLDTIVKRIKSSKNIRPMLDYSKLEKSIESIFKKREPIYKLADITIQTSNKNKAAIVAEIKKNL